MINTYELKKKIQDFFYYNKIYINIAKYVALWVILLAIIFLLITFILKEKNTVEKGDWYGSFWDGFDYAVNYKNPADEWIKSMKFDKPTYKNYNGINALFWSINATPDINNTATKETFDKIVKFVQSKWLDNANTNFSIATENGHPVFDWLMTLSVESKDLKKDIEEIRKFQEEVIERYPLKDKTILNNTFENQMDRYAMNGLSFTDFYTFDQLKGDLKTNNSAYAALAMDYTSLLKMVGEKARALIQNDWMIASKYRVLNIDEYMSDWISFNNIYTLNGFLLLYPEAIRYKDVINLSPEMKKDFLNYIKEWFEATKYFSMNNSDVEQTGDNNFYESSNKIVKYSENFQNNYRLKYFNNIKEYLIKNVLSTEEKNLYEKYRNNDLQKKLLEYNINKKDKIKSNIVIKEDQKGKIVIDKTKQNVTEIEKYLRIERKIFDYSNMLIAFMGNIPMYFYTYLITDEAQDDETTKLILDYLGKYDYDFEQEDLPTLNYDNAKTFKPFIFDVQNYKTLIEPQNDNINLEGDLGLYQSWKAKIAGVVVEWPICKKIDILNKKYPKHMGLSKLRRQFWCDGWSMLFNFYQLFTSNIYKKSADFFTIIKDKEPKYLNLEHYNLFAKIYPDILIWRFSKASDRAKFYEDFSNALLSKDWDRYMGKYYTYFKSYDDYQKLHNNIAIMSTITAYETTK